MADIVSPEPTPPVPESLRGKGFLAVCASCLVPGLGHFLFGAHRRAAIWLIISAAACVAISFSLITPRLLSALLFLVPVGLLVTLALYVDAFRAARRSPIRLGGPAVRYASGIVLLLVCMMVNPAQLMLPLLTQRVHTYRAVSGAMRPTLQPGDRFMVHYRYPPDRWDLVVLYHPDYGEGVPIVSRLVGLPGEMVEIRDNELHINGNVGSPPPGAGPYITMEYSGHNNLQLAGKIGAGCAGNPIRLGADEFFVLGDQSQSARDARLWETPVNGHQLGALPADHLVPGRVTAIYWPPSRWRLFR